MLAVHEEGEGVATRREVGFVAEKLVDVIRNVTHEAVSMQFVDGIAWNKEDWVKVPCENGILSHIGRMMLQILFNVWHLWIRAKGKSPPKVLESHLQ